jgi:hypothetical protein
MMLVVIAVKGLSVSAYSLALSQHVGTLRFRWLVGCSESWFDCWCGASCCHSAWREVETKKIKTHQIKLFQEIADKIMMK